MNGIHKPCILWLSQFPKVALQQETLFVTAVGVEMMRAGMPAPSTGILYNFNFSTCSLILSNSSKWIVSSCNLAYSSLANATFSAL